MLDQRYFDQETGELLLEGYKAIYCAIVDLAGDAEGYGLFKRIQDIDIEKSKWVMAIYETLSDVPLGRAEHILKYRKIKFSSTEFIEEQGDF